MKIGIEGPKTLKDEQMDIMEGKEIEWTKLFNVGLGGGSFPYAPLLD